MTPGEASVEVYHATDEELAIGVRNLLNEVGVTADELREQARTGDFTSPDAEFAWFWISDLLDLA